MLEEKEAFVLWGANRQILVPSPSLYGKLDTAHALLAHALLAHALLVIIFSFTIYLLINFILSFPSPPPLSLVVSFNLQKGFTSVRFKLSQLRVLGTRAYMGYAAWEFGGADLFSDLDVGACIF